MPKKSGFPLPITLLLLDIAGAILVAWGLYDLVSGGTGWASIVAGFLLMLPLGLHFIRRPGEPSLRGSAGDGDN